MKFTFDTLFPGLPEWIKEKTDVEDYINSLDGFLPKLRKYLAGKDETASIIFDDVQTDIATNKTDIATNKTDIATNKTDIAKNAVFTMVFQVKRPKLKVEASPTCAILAPCACTIIKARAYVKTASSGASIYMDINKNGTTVWTTQGDRMTIIAGAHTAMTSIFNVTAVAEYDIMTMDIDQVGSGTAGADLTLQVTCTRD